MVKISKEMTHIYHNDLQNLSIAIGANKTKGKLNYELFQKALVLTSDIQRLPFLLGGKLYFWYDSHIFGNIAGSAITGLGVTVVLLNGTYDSADFADMEEVFDSERTMQDVLLISHATFQITEKMADIQTSHWDFEGKVVLFDTISLLMFLDANTNVGTADFASNNIKAIYELEIDWAPISAKELQEFITEHIYAKQGD